MNDLVRKIRNATGAPLGNIVDAVRDADGDEATALGLLRERGISRYSERHGDTIHAHGCLDMRADGTVYLNGENVTCNRSYIGPGSVAAWRVPTFVECFERIGR